MRLFVSLEIPDALKDACTAFQDTLRATHSIDGTYVRPEQMHITLAFMGDVEHKQRAAIQENLKLICFAPFELCSGRIEMIDDRLIWVRVHNEHVANVALKVAALVSPYCTLDRKFVGHVTLVRIKKVHAQDVVEALVRESSWDPICFSVHSVELQQSELTPEGPRYIVIQRMLSEGV